MKKNWLSVCVVFFTLLCVAVPVHAENLFVMIVKSFLGSDFGAALYCWFCPMFNTIFNGIDALATTLCVKMSQTFLLTMAVGLLFSIAFKVSKILISFQPVELMQFLNDLFRHLGRAIIATALLTFSLAIFKYLLNPLFSLAMALGITIISEASDMGQFLTAVSAGSQAGAALTGAPSSSSAVVGTLCTGLKLPGKDAITEGVEKLSIGEVQSFKSATESYKPQAFGEETRDMMICMLRTMSAGVMFGMIVGGFLAVGGFTVYIIFKIPRYDIIFLGVVLMLAHGAILLNLPFKLVDAVLRLGFVAALMPLWIVLWVFPATVGYTKKAWEMFLSSIMMFVVMSVVLVLILRLLATAFGNVDDLIQNLINCNVSLVASQLQLGGRQFLVTLAICAISYKMLDMAQSLGSAFMGAMPDLGVGKALSNVAASGAKLAGSAAMAGGRLGSKLAGKGLRAMGVDTDKLKQRAGSVAKGAATVLLGGPIVGGTIVASRLGHKYLQGKRAAARAQYQQKVAAKENQADSLDRQAQTQAQKSTNLKNTEAALNSMGVKENATVKDLQNMAANEKVEQKKNQLAAEQSDRAMTNLAGARAEVQQRLNVLSAPDAAKKMDMTQAEVDKEKTELTQRLSGINTAYAQENVNKAKYVQAAAVAGARSEKLTSAANTYTKYKVSNRAESQTVAKLANTKSKAFTYQADLARATAKRYTQEGADVDKTYGRFAAPLALLGLKWPSDKA